MKLTDVKVDTYIGNGLEHNKKDPKLKVGDHVRVSKYKNIFAKCFAQNWSEKFFVVKKVKKILYHGHTSSAIPTVKKLWEHFVKRSCKRQAIKNLVLEKQSRERVKDYVKWKGYNNSFKS